MIVTRDNVLEQIYNFGVVPMFCVMRMYMVREMFEKAGIVNEVLVEHCDRYDIKMPNDGDDLCEEYETAFWRLGLSGSTGVKNMPYYIMMIWMAFDEDISDIVEFDTDY